MDLKPCSMKKHCWTKWVSISNMSFDYMGLVKLSGSGWSWKKNHTGQPVVLRRGAHSPRSTLEYYRGYSDNAGEGGTQLKKYLRRGTLVEMQPLQRHGHWWSHEPEHVSLCCMILILLCPYWYVDHNVVVTTMVSLICFCSTGEHVKHGDLHLPIHSKVHEIKMMNELHWIWKPFHSIAYCMRGRCSRVQ